MPHGEQSLLGLIISDCQHGCHALCCVSSIRHMRVPHCRPLLCKIEGCDAVLRLPDDNDPFLTAILDSAKKEYEFLVDAGTDLSFEECGYNSDNNDGDSDSDMETRGNYYVPTFDTGAQGKALAGFAEDRVTLLTLTNEQLDYVQESNDDDFKQNNRKLSESLKSIEMDYREDIHHLTNVLTMLKKLNRLALKDTATVTKQADALEKKNLRREADMKLRGIIF
jgi:hypothetical protein